MVNYNPSMQMVRLADVERDTHGLISKRTAELDGLSVTEVTFDVGARWSNDLGDACVVDQHVEAAEALLDLFRDRQRAGHIGDVKRYRSRVAADGTQPGSRLLAAARVPCTDQYRHAKRGELLGSRAADPLVGSGNQRDPSGVVMSGSPGRRVEVVL